MLIDQSPLIEMTNWENICLFDSLAMDLVILKVESKPLNSMKHSHLNKKMGTWGQLHAKVIIIITFQLHWSSNVFDGINEDTVT